MFTDSKNLIERCELKPSLVQSKCLCTRQCISVHLKVKHCQTLFLTTVITYHKIQLQYEDFTVLIQRKLAYSSKHNLMQPRFKFLLTDGRPNTIVLIVYKIKGRSMATVLDSRSFAYRRPHTTVNGVNSVMQRWL